jgi:hypothetical protein
MKRTARLVGDFASLFVALFGIVLMARGLEIAKGPFPFNHPDWSLYRLDLGDPFQFYVGCALTAISLAFLLNLRPK